MNFSSKFHSRENVVFKFHPISPLDSSLPHSLGAVVKNPTGDSSLRMTTHQGSNDTVKGVKRELSRRSWTTEQEKMLLVALKELVVQGWKSDNGFRAGYLNKLQEAMRKAFPSANIKGHPHILSKLTGWKRTYGTLITILNRSGIGFNSNGDHKVDASPELWEELQRVDGNAEKIRGRSWPLLEGWKEVFGKDRAIGDGAADMMGMVNDLIHDHEKEAATHQNEDEYVNLEDEVDEVPAPTAEDSVGQSNFGDVRPQKNHKKRKVEESIDALVELIGDIQKNSSAKYQLFSSSLGYQANIGKGKSEMFELLHNIPSLSLDEVFEVGEKLQQKPEKLEFFILMPEAARPAYVTKLMKGDK